jgi:RHS repeat-associated protein
VGQRQPKIFYYEADGLGSVTSLTDPTGAVAATYTYDSFGFMTASTGSATNWLRYTARQFDSDTGLYYYRARYYDPTTGRFLSEDPVRFDGGLDFYPYASNNPANLTDPFGLCPPLNKCAQRILDTVNNQFGTDFTAADVTDLGVNPNGGEYVIDIKASSATWLTASQFNAVQPGRFTSFTGMLTGLEPSLHVGPSPLDPTAGSFQSSNVGGFLSLDFTAHTDSGFLFNPIGALRHLFIDVLGHKSRNPCP